MTDAKRIIVRRESDADVLLVRSAGVFRDRGFGETIIIPGHDYVSYTPPVLMTGPVATPGTTTCNISWTVDVPAYHRVRYRKADAGSWQYTGWTAIPNASASIDLSGL